MRTSSPRPHLSPSADAGTESSATALKGRGHRVCVPLGELAAMGSRIWLDFGPDVAFVREQMSLHPPDPGSLAVEDDGERITAVVWTHLGERCSVSTPIVIARDV